VWAAVCSRLGGPVGAAGGRLGSGGPTNWNWKLSMCVEGGAAAHG
jgi:hypothetical protein